MFHNLRLAVAVQFALDGGATIELKRQEPDDSPWLRIDFNGWDRNGNRWHDHDAVDLFRAQLARCRTGTMEWREAKEGEFWIR